MQNRRIISAGFVNAKVGKTETQRLFSVTLSEMKPNKSHRAELNIRGTVVLPVVNK